MSQSTDASPLPGLIYKFKLADTIQKTLGIERPAAMQAKSSLRICAILPPWAATAWRFRNWRSDCLQIWLRDAYQAFDNIELYDLTNDRHETSNLAAERPEIVALGLEHFRDWYREQAGQSAADDPMHTVLKELPQPLLGVLDDYLQTLSDTGGDTGPTGWQLGISPEQGAVFRCPRLPDLRALDPGRGGRHWLGRRPVVAADLPARRTVSAPRVRAWSWQRAGGRACGWP